MGTLTAGQVVLIPFPFSDLSRAKMRPAIVLADAGREDWILCQVTSNPYGDEKALEITDQDFKSGSLRLASYARPGKLFTASESLISGKVGELKLAASNKLIQQVIHLFEKGIKE
jgi:mRNA interferase MazF